MKLPVHPERIADSGKDRCERCIFGRTIKPLETHAHHEATGIWIAELCGFENVATLFGEKGADRTYNSRAIGAGQRQNKHGIEVVNMNHDPDKETTWALTPARRPTFDKT